MFRLTILTLRNHQIMPYKRRLKIENMLAMLLFILLIKSSVSYCSVINGVRDNRVTYQSQLAKDVYLKSLQDTLRSQLQNITSSAAPATATSITTTAAATTSTVTSIDKFNISETEFTTKYNEYLRLVQLRRRQDEQRLNYFNGLNSNDDHQAAPFVDAANPPVWLQKTLPHRTRRHHRTKRAINNNDLIFMHFDLPPNMLNDSGTGSSSGTLDEAYLAMHLVRNKRPRKRPKKPRSIRLHAYQLVEKYDRVWLDTVTVNLTSFGNKPHRKVRLDVFRAVNSWLQHPGKNLGLQIYCENCHVHNVYVVHEEPADHQNQHQMHHGHNKLPTLHMDFNGRLREKRHRVFKPTIQDYSKQHHVKCSRKNEKCCRRQLKVQFKELAGLDFVIQPKMFDAGYCEGTCPTAYNPAHEHAVLQGKLADLGKYNVPRPCCTPSILSDIDVLHVDEEDSTKLKVTTFKNMRVLQCACS